MSDYTDKLANQIIEQLDEPFYLTDDWAVIRGDVLNKRGYVKEYFFVWVGKHPIDPKLAVGAQKLKDDSYRQIFPGYIVEFHDQPSPGFIVQTRTRWDFEDNKEAAIALEKILWEANRLARM